MARVHRLPWRALIGVVLALAGFALGWLWFRESSFAAVERVTIVGSASSESEQVRAALASAAGGMSTLHVDREALERAVEPFASVDRLRVEPDFPHELRIEVVEHEPVAAVRSGSGTVPVTAGGLVLDGVRAEDLPTVTSRAPLSDGRVGDRRALQALKVAALAPPELRERSERITHGDDGLTLDLRDGPELVFGDASEAAAKWRAAARVLAAESATGAVYLDLRVPGVVAAGGVGPVTPVETPVPGVEASYPQP